MAPFVQDIRNTQNTHGAAVILGIGTANPPNVIHQDNYTDFYFRVTNSDHMIDLKNKFKRMCDKTTIKKRHMYVTEEFFKENPHLCDTKAFSLDARQEILSKQVPMLGKQAADNAIKEWGQSKSNITHLIFCTMSGVHAPGADYQLIKLLSLRPSVRRFMLYHQGCHGGATALRLAKDLAENNYNARVLVVCSEIMSLVSFHGPMGMNFDSLIGQALFGDGASAAIVGANPIVHVENPLFQLVWAGQTMLPDSEGAIEANLKEIGVVIHLHKDVPNLISNNINNVLNEAFGPMDNMSDWNSIFWVAHPGGPAILDQVEVKGGLKKEKLDSSRYVLSEYGNMSSACLLFVLDDMRKRSAQEGKSTTGEGLDWGVLFGFGPGLTVETMVLRSMPLA